MKIGIGIGVGNAPVVSVVGGGPVADFTADPLMGSWGGDTPIAFTYTGEEADAWQWEKDTGSGYSVFSTDQDPDTPSSALGDPGDSVSVRLTAYLNGVPSSPKTKLNYISITA